MIKIITFVSCIFILNVHISQTNASMDFGINKEQQILTLQIEKKKSSICYSFGLGYGNFGRLPLSNYTTGSDRKIPYPNVFSGKEYSFDVINYSSLNLGVSIGFGLGCFWELNKKNRLKLVFSSKYHAVKDHFTYTAQNRLVPEEIVYEELKIEHQNISFTFQLQDDFKFSKRFGCFIGLSLPYYFPLRTQNYDADVKAQMAGVENPLLNLGLFYEIKKK